MRQSGATLAATNDLSAGSVCKRRDAVTLGRKKGLQPRANERPADSFSFKLGGPATRLDYDNAGKFDPRHTNCVQSRPRGKRRIS